ncbi:toprim domain-containing protein [Rufibacter sediminis]|uniref:Toprim domain-containing protein n=1 Tax=Rufibacter sediminis TaxID=2762756 RepID=A0ABR6VTW0_9BACT|nr:toprim domain-containing protein [Rufibacter sediminis]MBC3540642.1 toprim domain-containing protein [Rufibacter sediminis]
MANLSLYTNRIQYESSRPTAESAEKTFLDLLRQFGAVNIKELVPGKVMRFPLAQSPKKNLIGWAWYNESQEIGFGAYGSFNPAYGPEKVTWCSKDSSTMTLEERQQFTAHLEASRLAHEEETRKRQEKAAAKASLIWKAAGYADNNPYLERKQVIPYKHVRQNGSTLIIPITRQNALTSLQLIKPDGSKKFLTGGRIKGCHFKIEGKEDTVYVAEGYATGASIAMATGATVYVAFNAGNLFEIASIARSDHPDARIVIGGDDDQFKPSNAGRTKGQQAADGLGIEIMFPRFSSLEGEPVDWNDLHCREGLEAVREQLRKKPRIYQQKTVTGFDENSLRPSGILGELVSYYHATSGNYQPGFAIQSAIAIASIVCARNFETNMANRASLFMMCLGKSATGKEHIKRTIERVLDACGLEHLVSGGGYTSSGAVFSEFLAKPRHITVVDEFSKELETAGKQSNGQMLEAKKVIMEAFGRTDGILRPKVYSTMTKEKAKETKIINPALTFMALSVPDDLFSSLDVSSIKDGFLNRFIINVSDAERSIRQHKPALDVPGSIIEWAKAIFNRTDKLKENPNVAPTLVTLDFTMEAMNAQEAYQKYCIEKMNAFERFGMAELFGRSNEIAMRLSLIAALSDDPNATVIELKHIDWAIAWVKHNMDNVANKLKMSISNSEFEGWKKEWLGRIRQLGEQGISEKEMHKTPPFSKYRERERKEIIHALVESELIVLGERRTGKAGRPVMAYMAVEND